MAQLVERLGKLNSPGTMQSSSTNYQMDWKFRKDKQSRIHYQISQFVSNSSGGAVPHYRHISEVSDKIK